MLAAEEIVAREGLGSLSARKVTRASAQKNNFSVQYHFGTLEELLWQVAVFRMQQINDIRADIIKDLNIKIEDCQVSQIVELLFIPNVILAKLEPKGANHASFLSQYLPSILSSSLRWPAWNPSLNAPTIVVIVQALKERLVNLSPAQFDQRLLNATTLFLNVVYHLGHRGLFESDADQSEDIIQDTLAQCTAILMAPKFTRSVLHADQILIQEP